MLGLDVFRKKMPKMFKLTESLQICLKKLFNFKPETRFLLVLKNEN